MLENNTYFYKDKSLTKYFEDLQNNDKIFGAFIFGSRFHGDFREDSDYDIALFTDLDFFDIADIEEDLNNNHNIQFDISDISELPILIQEEVLYDTGNVIFLKKDYEINWLEHERYLQDEIEFKKLYRGDISGIYKDI